MILGTIALCAATWLQASEVPTVELTVAANCPGSIDRPAHQLWLISSRSASACLDHAATLDTLRFWQADAMCRWIPGSPAEFLAGDDPSIPTVVWIHGNQVEAERAMEMGYAWYRRLRGSIDSPLRFVIWSWPSQNTGGSLRDDARFKAAISEAHGYYLALLARQMNSDVPLTLVGYSFGARLVTSSLHLMGGGRIGRLQFDSPNARRPLHAVLLAAALDNDWLVPGRRHGQALSQVDDLLILMNSCDPVLKFYPLLCPRSHAVALGREGLSGWSRLGEQRGKVEQIDVSRAIGRHHDWRRYAAAGHIVHWIGQRCTVDLPPEAISQVASTETL